MKSKSKCSCGCHGGNVKHIGICKCERKPIMCMTDDERLAQANRLIPWLEAEISSGETRPMFQQLLDSQRRVLDELGPIEDWSGWRQSNRPYDFS